MTHKKQRCISPNVAEYPPGHWSNCLRVGDIAYVSGMTARASDLQTIQGQGAYDQANVIITMIRHCIETSAGPRASSSRLWARS